RARERERDDDFASECGGSRDLDPIWCGKSRRWLSATCPPLREPGPCSLPLSRLCHTSCVCSESFVSLLTAPVERLFERVDIDGAGPAHHSIIRRKMERTSPSGTRRLNLAWPLWTLDSTRGTHLSACPGSHTRG